MIPQAEFITKKKQCVKFEKVIGVSPPRKTKLLHMLRRDLFAKRSHEESRMHRILRAERKIKRGKEDGVAVSVADVDDFSRC
jgi:hypothetical protein